MFYPCIERIDLERKGKKMHFNNLLQFVPEFVTELNLILILVCLVFGYAVVVSLRNYFTAITEVYSKADYQGARFMGRVNKFTIAFLVMLPFLVAAYLVFLPYEFILDGNKEVTITGYSGGSKVKIPEKILVWDVTGIKRDLFKDNEMITEVILPSSIKYINEYAFSNAINLEKITFSDSVISIGVFAFANCKKLDEITIPGEETDIGTGAFINTKWLYQRKEDYVILGNQHYIYVGEDKEVHVPAGVETVDFYVNDFVEHIILPKSITAFKKYCFQGCSALQFIEPFDLNVPWGAFCFGGCYQLNSYNGKNYAFGGSYTAREVERPFEVDWEFKQQCRKEAGVVKKVIAEENSEVKGTDIVIEKSPQYEECIEAYSEFLKNYTPDYGGDNIMPRYGCVHIDADGLPELLIVDEEAYISSVKVFAYNDGKVESIGQFGQYGTIRYARGYGKIVSDKMNRTGSWQQHIYYEYQNGILEELGSITKDFDGKYTVYYINDEKVSEAAHVEKKMEYEYNFEYVSFSSEDGYNLSDETGLKNAI